MNFNNDAVQAVLNAGFISVMIQKYDRRGLELVADLNGDGSVCMVVLEISNQIKVYTGADRRQYRLVEIDGNVVERFESIREAAEHVAKGRLSQKLFQENVSAKEKSRTWTQAAIRLDLERPSREKSF